MSGVLYDKNRRPILEHDVLKVYHFTGARKKKHYMYKQACGIILLGKAKIPYLQFKHLERSGGHYHVEANGQILTDYEIVQGFGPGDLSYDDRKRTDVPTVKEG